MEDVKDSMKKETVLALGTKQLLDSLCPITTDLATQRKLISIHYDNNLVPLSVSELEAIFSNYNNLYFLPREIAEVNNDYIHVIPYIIIRHKERFLSYWRNKGAGENRLHGKMSIGFGGHINTTSANHTGEALDVNKTITSNISQELFEELGINVMPILGRDALSSIDLVRIKQSGKSIIKLHDDRKLTLLGIIMSGASEVNRVHLGLVFLLNWDEISTSQRGNEDGIDTFNYYSVDELQQFMPAMENWSQIALQFIMDSEFIYD
jgi:predicted NUDIX family phosphoesterase